jgi:hypothetical protein
LQQPRREMTERWNRGSLRRIYRRGRKAMQHAQADPTNENLHEWRKRVKDLWHAEQILRPARSWLADTVQGG